MNRLNLKWSCRTRWIRHDLLRNATPLCEKTDRWEINISYTRIELCHASVECIENVESIFTINQLSIELAGSFDVSSESVYIYTFPNVLSVPLRKIDDLYRVMQSNLP